MLRQHPSPSAAGVDPAVYVDRRWRNARRYWFAATLGAFPFLFIMDAWWDPAFSPVIPGLVVLLVMWVAGPFLTMERWSRHVPNPERQEKRSMRSRYALGTAIAWLLLWLVFLL